MRGARRTASPVRLTINPTLGGDIDGAWWPHTGSLAKELPELIHALHPALGEIVDISINWSATAGAPVMNTHNSSALAKMRWNDSRQRIMVVVGQNGTARILVIPHTTMAALSVMVLRRAAGMPVPLAEVDSAEYQAADRVVRAACEQNPVQPAAEPTS